MQAGISIIVVEKYPIIRWAIKQYYSHHNRIVVLEMLASAPEALAATRLRVPDVVVIDTPDIDSSDAVSKLVSCRKFGVVSFSTSDSWDYVEKFMKAGGLGFVPKTAPLEDLTNAIEAAAAQKVWIAPSMRSTGHILRSQKNADKLSDREREVIELIAEGNTSKQIADQLCLSVNTVESHRKRIFRKLNVRSSAQLVKYVLQRGA